MTLKRTEGKRYRQKWWWVTHYEGYPAYHAEEGGYVYPCTAMFSSFKIKGWSNAIDMLRWLADDCMCDVGCDTWRRRSGKYIGDETLFCLEAPWEKGNMVQRPTIYQ